MAFFFQRIMTEETRFDIGEFSKLHGFKGELTLYIYEGDPEEYEDLEDIEVRKEDVSTKYTVVLAEKKTNTTLKVKLEGIDSEEAAKKLLKSVVSVSREELNEAGEFILALEELTGYKVVDATRGEAGIVKGILNQPLNPLLEVQLDKHVYLLPVHEDIIIDVDHDNKVMQIDAPEGLIDLNVNP